MGQLDFDGVKHAALLADGNADGLFDTVGEDRVWIDLDDDGRFDPLLEQFPLGKPITSAGKLFVVSSNATASAVRARRRSGAEAKLRAVVGGKPPKARAKIDIELISDLGELVSIDRADAPVPVLAGEYHVVSAELSLPDKGGRTWTYHFGGRGGGALRVEAGQERRLELLKHLVLEAWAQPPGGMAMPGGTVNVRPELLADDSLSLTSCRVEDSEQQPEAEVTLLSPAGARLSSGRCGFS